MDELTQFLALKDGVTAPLRNMNRAVEELYDSQEEAAQAVSRLEGQLNGLGSTASRTGGLMSEVSSGLKGMVGQFAIGNIAANLFMSAADFVAQLPGKIMKASDAYSGMMARLNLVTGSEQEAA